MFVKLYYWNYLSDEGCKYFLLGLHVGQPCPIARALLHQVKCIHLDYPTQNKLLNFTYSQFLLWWHNLQK